MDAPKRNSYQREKMSDYKPAITKQDDSFYALIVRIEDNQEIVIHGYKGRFFKTEKAAIKSTTNHINKFFS